jgi:lysophospholipase L1-like esterase
MRITITALFVLLAVGLTACDKLGSGGSSPTTPSGPPPAGSNIVYAAVGASDVMGVGSTKTCSPFDDCNGNGYVWVAARALRSQGFTVEVAQLGIPAGVISATFQNLGIQYGRTIGGNFLQSEVPFVKRDAGLVTVFAGANDVNTITAALGGGAGGSNPTAYIDQMVNAFGTDYSTLISGIRARATSARIIALNLPNLAAMPYLAGASLAQKQAAQRAAVRITTTIINPKTDTTVIDLMCDPRLYQASIFSSDGFHPNDAGYALLGAEIVTALTSPSYPAPKSSCSQMTIF